jgi:hypothetical protein
MTLSLPRILTKVTQGGLVLAITLQIPWAYGQLSAEIVEKTNPDVKLLGYAMVGENPYGTFYNTQLGTQANRSGPENGVASTKKKNS